MPQFHRSATGIIELEPLSLHDAPAADDSTLDNVLASFAHRENLANDWAEEESDLTPQPRYSLTGIEPYRRDSHLSTRSEWIQADLVELAAELQREYELMLQRTNG